MHIFIQVFISQPQLQLIVFAMAAPKLCALCSLRLIFPAFVFLFVCVCVEHMQTHLHAIYRQQNGNFECS